MCICNCDGKRPNETCCWLSPYGHRCCRVTWAWIAYVLVLCILIFDMVVHGIALGSTHSDSLTNTFLHASHIVLLSFIGCLWILVYLSVIPISRMSRVHDMDKVNGKADTQNSSEQERDEENPKSRHKHQHPSTASAPAARVVCEGQPGAQPQHTGYEPVVQVDNP